MRSSERGWRPAVSAATRATFRRSRRRSASSDSQLACRTSSAWKSRASRPSGAVRAARPVVRRSCRRAHRSAPRMSSGRAERNASARTGSKGSWGGSCQRTGPELCSEPQDPGREEIGQRRLKASQLEHVRDVPAALDGEQKVRRNRSAPGVAGRRPGQRVEGPIDLDGRESLREITEPLLRRDSCRIEPLPPVRVVPATRSNPGRHVHGCDRSNPGADNEPPHPGPLPPPGGEGGLRDEASEATANPGARTSDGRRGGGSGGETRTVRLPRRC